MNESLLRRPCGSTAPRAKWTQTVRPVSMSVALALAQWLAPPALADSGTGVDTVVSNALSSGPGSAPRQKDPEGLSAVELTRNPTGLLNASPSLIRKPTETASGWWIGGFLELGALEGGSPESAYFRKFKSLAEGFYFSTAKVEARDDKDGRYFNLHLGALDESDRFGNLQLGRVNSWRLGASFSGTEHVFTTGYRSLWSGVGGADLALLTLPASPKAPATAASADIAIGEAALATPSSTLSIQRNKSSLRADLHLPFDLQAYFTASSEKRTGARPFGMVMGPPGATTAGIEVPESIDHDTVDFAAGLQWNRDHTSINLQATASMFRNNIGTQRIASPLFVTPANGLVTVPSGTFDLAPDNNLYGAKVEVAQAFPSLWKSRITGVYSVSKARQDDALIASTAHAGVAVDGVAGGNWDSVNSLSRSSAQAAVDTQLLDVGLSATPHDRLNLRAKYQHYETTTLTDYWACNPLTGQWGRVLNDGSAASMVTAITAAGVNPAGTLASAFNAARCNLDAAKALNLVPAAGNIPIRSIPFDQAKTLASGSAEFKITPRQHLTASLERETIERRNRERERTWEDTAKLGYVNRDLATGTLRIGYEQGRRRGTVYESDPNATFYSATLGPVPKANGTNVASWIHVNGLMRKFDLADRDAKRLNLRFNLALRDDLDLALSGQHQDHQYVASEFGRVGAHRQSTAGADLNWQPAPDTNVYASLSRQASGMSQRGVAQNACVLGQTYYLFSDGVMATSATPTAAQVAAGITVVGNSGVVTGANFAALCGSASATSPLYPTSRAWSVQHEDSGNSLSLGVRKEFKQFTADASYSRTRGRTALSYTYNPQAMGTVTSGATTAAQATTLALIGAGFPDLTFEQDVAEVNLLVPVKRDVSLRLLMRREVGKFKDFHYDGVAAAPTPQSNQMTFLDTGPQDYRSLTLGLMLQMQW